MNLLLGSFFIAFVIILWFGLIIDDYCEKIRLFRLKGKEKYKYIIARIVRDIIVCVSILLFCLVAIELFDK